MLFLNNPWNYQILLELIWEWISFILWISTYTLRWRKWGKFASTIQLEMYYVLQYCFSPLSNVRYVYTRSLGSAIHIYYMVLYTLLFVLFSLQSPKPTLTCSLYSIFDISNDDSSQHFYAGYCLWQILSILPCFCPSASQGLGAWQLNFPESLIERNLDIVQVLLIRTIHMRFGS